MTPYLPTELLGIILRYATCAGVDPYPVIPHTNHDSHWFAIFEEDDMDTMGTKIALTRVSRGFRRIALEFLFEVVSIQKPSNALKLVETMKKQSSNIELGPREWVKFLFVRFSESNMRVVTKLLHLCRSLRGFSWIPAASKTRFKDREAAQDEMIQNIPTNIQFLHWNARVQFNVFAALLQRASASLRILCTNGIMDEAMHPPPLICASYPSLTHLHVEHWNSFRFDWVDTVTSGAPSLVELSLFDQGWGGDFTTAFRKSGKSLRVLRLSHLASLLLSHIFDTCPNLEDIYYSTATSPLMSHWAPDATHVKLKKVEVTFSLDNYGDIDVVHHELRYYFGTISRTRFPLLDTIIVHDESSNPLIPQGCRLLVRRLEEYFLSADISVIY